MPLKSSVKMEAGAESYLAQYESSRQDQPQLFRGCTPRQFESEMKHLPENLNPCQRASNHDRPKATEGATLNKYRLSAHKRDTGAKLKSHSPRQPMARSVPDSVDLAIDVPNVVTESTEAAQTKEPLLETQKENLQFSSSSKENSTNHKIPSGQQKAVQQRADQTLGAFAQLPKDQHKQLRPKVATSEEKDARLRAALRNGADEFDRVEALR